MNELIKEAQLELQAETIVNETLVKLAKKEKKETYPISRALTSPAISAAIGAGSSVLGGPGMMALGGGVSGGISYLSRSIQGRALRGRIITGKGLTNWEKKNVKLNPTDKKETYPISRLVTSTPTMAVVGGSVGASLGWVTNKGRLEAFLAKHKDHLPRGKHTDRLLATALVVKNRLNRNLIIGGAIGAAGLFAGGTWLSRWLYARSVVGNKNLPKSKSSLTNWEKKNL